MKEAKSDEANPEDVEVDAFSKFLRCFHNGDLEDGHGLDVQACSDERQSHHLFILINLILFSDRIQCHELTNHCTHVLDEHSNGCWYLDTPFPPSYAPEYSAHAPAYYGSIIAILAFRYKLRVAIIMLYRSQFELHLLTLIL